MRLRQGKTKDILKSSIDAALLAVEVYNKPRVSFRSQAYITLMNIAWTRMFHAYFNNTIGNKYYYKKKNGRYEIVDGEKKAWELKTCISKYGELSESVKANLIFFIKLRNKIEHRAIDKKEIDIKIFGECQSLLFNYENELIKLFGEDYALNEALAFAVQFSFMRTTEQKISNKRLLSKEMTEINKYIDNYRNSLSNPIFASQEYSIKLVQIPKIANASRSDLAIEFVRWDKLTKEERKEVSKITALVKEKIVTKRTVNLNCFKPGKIIQKVNLKLSGNKIHHGDHRALISIFHIRPLERNPEDPFETNDKYCLYDGVHKDYVYTQEWIDLLIRLINEHKWFRESWRGKKRRGEFKNPDDF